ALAKESAQRLKKLGYTNVQTKAGDGFKGWPEQAPFNKIIVTCSPESVPQPLVDQLREGGKMIVPLGERYQQAFYLFEKKDGKLVENKLLPTLFVPMTGMAEAQRKSKNDPAHPRIVNGGFEDSTEDVADGWFYQRQASLEHSGAREGKSYITFANTEPGRDAHALQALGIDGAQVRSIRISLLVKLEGALPGTQAGEQPALAVSFFDSENQALKSEYVGPWRGTFNWKRFSREVKVPKETKMAMIQVGLRGATGRMSVDDVRLSSSAR